MNEGVRKLLEAAGLLGLRVSISALMLFGHGLGKLTGWSAKVATFPDPLGIGSRQSLALAIFGEVLCPALVAAGFFTRLAAVPAAVTMAVAFFLQHAADPFAKRELAAVYGLAFVAIALLGGGEWSLDGVMRRRREGRKDSGKLRM